MSDLQLNDQDEVLLESIVLAASDNVARAESSKRSNYAPERRRAFVETDGDNVYLGTGDAWVDVSENTGLVSALFQGGDANYDSVNTKRITDEDVFDGGPISYTLDADEKRAIDPSKSKPQATFIINSSRNSQEGLISTQGSNDLTEIIVAGANISNSEGTDNSINVFFDSTNDRYEIENTHGGQTRISIFKVGLV